MRFEKAVQLRSDRPKGLWNGEWRKGRSQKEESPNVTAEVQYFYGEEVPASIQANDLSKITVVCLSNAGKTRKLCKI